MVFSGVVLKLKELGRMLAGIEYPVATVRLNKETLILSGLAIEQTRSCVLLSPS
jgi:hypothetical protein